MKIILIFLFALTGLSLINFAMDILMGSHVKIAITNILNPLWVTEPVEYVLGAVLLLVIFFQPVFTSVKKKKGSRKANGT